MTADLCLLIAIWQNQSVWYAVKVWQLAQWSRLSDTLGTLQTTDIRAARETFVAMDLQNPHCWVRKCKNCVESCQRQMCECKAANGYCAVQSNTICQTHLFLRLIRCLSLAQFVPRQCRSVISNNPHGKKKILVCWMMCHRTSFVSAAGTLMFAGEFWKYSRHIHTSILTLAKVFFFLFFFTPKCDGLLVERRVSRSQSQDHFGRKKKRDQFFH